MHCIAKVGAIAVIVIAVAVAACGDNSRVCGPGTSDVDGTCTATTQCGPGTIQHGDGTCVPDGADCQNGTVLIGNRCVDPATGLVIDVEEGPEPNGLGVATGVEQSDVDAGEITLKAEGDTLVVHGHITPFQDADGDGALDADYDTYLVSIERPTLLEISVDGVDGIDGAFLIVGNGLGIARWERFGMPITGDTSKRPIYLPAAGDYAIVVGDARSMVVGRNPPFTGQAVPAGTATSEYYVSITAVPVPDATPIAVTDHAGAASGSLGIDDIKFFSVTMGLGFNRAALTTGTALANPAVVIDNNLGFRGQATNDPHFSTSAEILLAGFKDGDHTIVVVDASYNLATAPVHFDLAITTGDAKPLSRTGGAVDETVLTTSPVDGFERSNVYFFDVGAVNELDGLALAWSQPVDGVLIDQDRFVAALFTFDPNVLAPTGHTFTDYAGALRFFAAGRYYFAVYPPGGTVGDTLTATSTLSPLTTTAVTEGTPLTDATPNGFGTRLFTYTAAAIWQSIDVTGTGTGDRTVAFMDPDSAYGSLSPVSIDGGTVLTAPDPPVIFAHTFAAPPSTTGHIVATDPTKSYLVAVSTQTGAGAITLDFAPRTFFDFGTAAAGDTKTHVDQITAATPERLYLIKTDPGDAVTISLPSPGSLAIDVIDVDEVTKQSADTGGSPGTVSTLRGVNQSGLIAFRVRAITVPGAPINFTVTVQVALGFYSAHVGTTPFTDACATGTPLVLTPDPDDGLSAPIATPAGFTFYGAATTQLVVSSNGWLGFNTAATSSSPFPVPLPDGVGEVGIAPLWQDLTDVATCTMTSGTRLIIQWTGENFVGDVGQFQAILDGGDSSIELVYGTTALTGADAVVGVQNLADEQSLQLGAFTPSIVSNSAVRLTHP